MIPPSPEPESSTPSIGSVGSDPTWSEMSVQERREVALEAMRAALTDRGFKVTGPAPGRSIVITAGRGNAVIEIHLRSSLGIGPAYWPKSILRLAGDRYGGLVLLVDGDPPRLYLIPSLDWASPDGVLVDRTYERAASAPEWGVNIPGALPKLGRYALDRVLSRY